jgi:hypothetical protein
MYHTTRLRKDQIVELCVRVNAAVAEGQTASWPPVLGLFKSVVAALTCLRRNRVQAEIGEAFEVSQPTISRAVTGLTEVLGRVLGEYVSVAENVDVRTQYVVDGTLLPCWSWHGQRQPCSGKHKTTGRDVQVVCDVNGRPAWISDPVDGFRHDVAALTTSGALDTLQPASWIGDRGYIGKNMIKPVRKPPHRELLDWETRYNTEINKIRYLIERTIANLKTWRILHTDYRRPLATFNETISTVIALHFYTLACE